MSREDELRREREAEKQRKWEQEKLWHEVHGGGDQRMLNRRPPVNANAVSTAINTVFVNPTWTWTATSHTGFIYSTPPPNPTRLPNGQWLDAQVEAVCRVGREMLAGV